MADHKDDIIKAYQQIWIDVYKGKVPEIDTIDLKKVNNEALKQLQLKAPKTQTKDNKLQAEFLDAYHTLTNELHYIRSIKESTLCAI